MLYLHLGSTRIYCFSLLFYKLRSVAVSAAHPQAKKHRGVSRDLCAPAGAVPSESSPLLRLDSAIRADGALPRHVRARLPDHLPPWICFRFPWALPHPRSAIVSSMASESSTKEGSCLMRLWVRTNWKAIATSVAPLGVFPRPAPIFQDFKHRLIRHVQ